MQRSLTTWTGSDQLANGQTISRTGIFRYRYAGGVSGIELVERVATHKPDIKTLLTSGYTDLDQLGYNSQVNTKAIGKNYMVDELAYLVREALDTEVLQEGNV